MVVVHGGFARWLYMLVVHVGCTCWCMLVVLIVSLPVPHYETTGLLYLMCAYNDEQDLTLLFSNRDQHRVVPHDGHGRRWCGVGN